jgi:hypothetical protein
VFDSVRTSTGFCQLWQMPPGGSNFPVDASFRRCALDRVPVLRHAPPIAAPRVGPNAYESFLIVVNPDGSVDPDRTRDYAMGGDREFHERALETIRRWRFDPGVRDGKPVRSAFPIWIVSNTRNDTIPSRLEWRYANGPEEDTLAGTWIAEEKLPPLGENQVAATHAAVVRELVRMRVVLPVNGRRYCLVLPGKDAVAHLRVGRLIQKTVPSLAGIGVLTWSGCGRDSSTRRVVLPEVYRTENGRIVVHPAGDDLPNWPPGYMGRSWRAWKARCVVQVATGSGEGDRPTCGVNPDASPDEQAAWVKSLKEPITGVPGGRPPGDSTRVTVFATTNGAYLTDTLQTTIGPLPHLDELAVRDPDLPCGGWSAHSAHHSADVYVVTGDPRGTSMFLTRVASTAPPVSRSGIMRCGRQEPRTSDFAAFLLGDVERRARGPVTLCYSRCARSYVLDPARHTLVDHAHIRFRLTDLRPDTRTGEQLQFLIVLDPAPANLLPLIIVRTGNRWPGSAWIARRVSPNAWDYPVISAEGYPPDTEVYLYLIAR